MVYAIGLVVGVMLLLLSGIHIYWLLGGRKGIKGAVPSHGSDPVFTPSKTATVIVAGGLALAAWFVLELSGIVERVFFSESLLLYGGWVLSIVFLLRAIGDFRWMGFFKKHKGTLFAKRDTMLYNPLCVVIGICIFIMTKY